MAGGQDDQPPLCVDLDGTLLLGDISVESLLMLLRRAPWCVFLLPFWLLSGRAHLKRRVAKRVRIDPAHLVYDDRVLDLVRTRPAGMLCVLASASDALLVEPIARHLGLFDQVFASDGRTNLDGRRKAAALIAAYGERGFDYAGNAHVDLAVWRHARRAIVVNARGDLVAAAARHAEIALVLPSRGGGIRAWLRALRPHQWLKNLLVFLPLLTAHRWHGEPLFAQALVAWLAFGLCASGTYIANDLADLGADRRHPRKRLRPFASGSLPIVHGLLAAPVLVAAAFALAVFMLPLPFALVLATYLVATLAYSFGVKRAPMLDVIVLAGLYTLRIIAGGAATGITVSFWLLSFSMFLFLGLAMLKRFTELGDLGRRKLVLAEGRGYSIEDLPLVRTLGVGSALLSVLVLALYIDSTAGEALYHHPGRLWLLCPLLLYWVARAWHLAERGRMHDDPVLFAATDKVSWLCLAAAALITGAAL